MSICQEELREVAPGDTASRVFFILENVLLDTQCQTILRLSLDGGRLYLTLSAGPPSYQLPFGRVPFHLGHKDSLTARASVGAFDYISVHVKEYPRESVSAVLLYTPPPVRDPAAPDEFFIHISAKLDSFQEIDKRLAIKALTTPQSSFWNWMCSCIHNPALYCKNDLDPFELRGRKITVSAPVERNYESFQPPPAHTLVVLSEWLSWGPSSRRFCLPGWDALNMSPHFIPMLLCADGTVCRSVPLTASEMVSILLALPKTLDFAGQ
ncbi:MAG: hypothetical protein CVU77_04420 [Elusimicrobia bacterium HGW-Elusimicrobia-1]|jgi:hypothetical protein|nr:MAG: hypothetical protein CVU77_04420 [Elusimicrobia bacterium HGW-Elusimicrobia-1]